MIRSATSRTLVFGALLAMLSACGGGAGTGTISGRIGADSPFGQQQQALLGQQGKALSVGLEVKRQPLQLDGISVELLRVGEGSDTSAWSVEASVLPEADGSFVFNAVAAGRYALRLQQPEFGGAGYAVDCTEFDLGDGDSVKLILPMLSDIDVSGPMSQAMVMPDQAALDVQRGLVLGLGPGFFVLDYLRGRLDVLFSRKLFSGLASESNTAALALAPDGQRAFIIMGTRILRVDLSIFKEQGADEVVDYDDPQVRLGLGDAVTWRWIPEDRRVVWDRAQREVYFSPDGSTLYISARWSFGQAQQGPLASGGTQVVDTATLEVKRVIMGVVAAYNPEADRLIFANGNNALLVDATMIRDAGTASFDGQVVSAAPIPGSPETLVVYQKLSSQDAAVAFLARVDADGQILQNLRASEYLGVNLDPAPGLAAFDEDGGYFTLGAKPFRVLEDGSFEELAVPVQPGPAFQERVSCNPFRVFDPVNRYEIWYGCDHNQDGLQTKPTAIALLSADQGSIPVSVRPGQMTNKSLLLDTQRGLAIFRRTNGFSLVHYADGQAAQRASQTAFPDLGKDTVPSPAVCSESQACPGTQLCLPDSDTAWTGRCVENPRLPFVPYCGGLTRLACDHGFTCKQENPSNPNSPGLCEGNFSYDFDGHGFDCDEARPCPAGFRCSQQGHCLPVGCLGDGDCAETEVCGLVAGVGRVCLTKGPLPDGELCYLPEQCQGGACLPAGEDLVSERIGLEAPWPLMLCTTPCFQNADCPEGAACHTTTWDFGAGQIGSTNAILYPICLGPRHPKLGETCDGGCAAHELCGAVFDPVTTSRKGECQVGFVPAQRAAGPCDGAWACPTPAVCSGFGLADCRLACTKASDCPFAVDCVQGSCAAVVNPNNPAAGPQQYLCADGEGCSDQQFCGMVDFYPKTGLLCLEGRPCQNDSDCTEGQTCQGLCTTDCDSGSDCPAGWQCVFGPDSGARRHCLPGVCACPDPSPLNANCVFETGVCSITTPCAPAPCDGTYGPDNCCDEGNPCNLEGQDRCRCPASCSWWTPEGCSPPHENPPAQGGVPLCPEGYSCKLVQGRLFGHGCDEQ